MLFQSFVIKSHSREASRQCLCRTFSPDFGKVTRPLMLMSGTNLKSRSASGFTVKLASAVMTSPFFHRKGLVNGFVGKNVAGFNPNLSAEERIACRCMRPKPNPNFFNFYFKRTRTHRDTPAWFVNGPLTKNSTKNFAQFTASLFQDGVPLPKLFDKNSVHVAPAFDGSALPYQNSIPKFVSSSLRVCSKTALP